MTNNDTNATAAGWSGVLRKAVPDVVMIVLFALVSVAYFWTPITEGMVLTGTDHNASDGLAVEMNHYRDTHDGERTRWTNSLFCGMPTYQIAPAYPSTETLNTLQEAYRLFLPDVAAYVFMMLLGFYILLRAFDFRAWMAALGAVLWAFSSYYFIIIAAGHIWKLLTLAYIPPTIAGIVLCYRGRYVWGVVVTGIFTAMQILSNHVQMSYYFLFVMLCMAVAYLVDAVRQHNLQHWLKASAAALVGGLLGLAINASNLYHTYEYSKETMRGKSELTQKTKDAADQTNSGLERSYITAWSYGIDETWTLLVPNTKGGASMPLTHSKKAMEKANPQFTQIYQQLGQYWGDQPGTSGPVYVGAFVLFLFVLGLFIVKGPMKWALLVATVLSILLSWGKNFMPFTDFFLDYVPMYDKFRTVASILVIAEFTIPMLAMLALKEIVGIVESPAEQSAANNSRLKKPFLGALLLTAGFCLLFWLVPDLFFGDYLSQQEHQVLGTLAQYGWPQNMVDMLIGNLSDMRRAVFTADALRSLIVILVGCGVLVLYQWRKIGEWSMVGGLALLCLVDMWGVNKRYLNDGMFVQPRPLSQKVQKTQADELILQDPDLYYRVLNQTVSTFNDNTTSFFHKSIGGYHAAKLRRYQELIEAHLTREMTALQQAAVENGGMLEECNGDSLYPVLNMLNMKYTILPTQSGPVPVANPWANGNAWFVGDVQYVPDADAELLQLGQIDTKHQAVADERFRSVLGDAAGDEGTVELTKYEANELHYTVESAEGGVLVFSEIYYPGWTCTVDAREVPIGRVNYVLRAIRINGGHHYIIMTFHPQSVATTETLAYAALALLILLLLAALWWGWRKKRAA